MSCRAIDMTGQRFGRLLVIERNFSPWSGTDKHARWWCQCDCGRWVSVLQNNLRPSQKSCGCHRSEVTAALNVTHGKSRTRAYRAWGGMIHRCTNQNYPGWEHYGGRGIAVCEHWRTSFENFYADMGDPPAGLSIDRENNNGNYEPGNCRWATALEQRHNRSDSPKYQMEAD